MWSETVPFITGAGGTVANKSFAFNGDTGTRAYTQGGTDTTAKSLTIDLTGKGFSNANYSGSLLTLIALLTVLHFSLIMGLRFRLLTIKLEMKDITRVKFGSADPIETIKINVNTGNDSAYVGAIEIGGVVLVDGGSVHGQTPASIFIRLTLRLKVCLIRSGVMVVMQMLLGAGRA